MADTQDKKMIKAAVERKKKATYTPVVPAMQLGFVHNNVDCIGCRACEIACKDKNGLAPGPRFRRVQYIEGGYLPRCLRLQGQHLLQPLRGAGLPANLSHRGHLEAQGQRHRRYRLDAVHRLPALRGGLPLRGPAVHPGTEYRRQVQPLRGRDRGWSQALLRHGLHDAGPGRGSHRPVAR